MVVEAFRTVTLWLKSNLKHLGSNAFNNYCCHPEISTVEFCKDSGKRAGDVKKRLVFTGFPLRLVVSWQR